MQPQLLEKTRRRFQHISKEMHLQPEILRRYCFSLANTFPLPSPCMRLYVVSLLPVSTAGLTCNHESKRISNLGLKEEMQFPLLTTELSSKYPEEFPQIHPCVQRGPFFFASITISAYSSQRRRPISLLSPWCDPERRLTRSLATTFPPYSPTYTRHSVGWSGASLPPSIRYSTCSHDLRSWPCPFPPPTH